MWRLADNEVASPRSGPQGADLAGRRQATFPEPSGVPSLVTPSPDPPIRVFFSDGYWRVAYGSYMDGFHAIRAEAIAVATRAAASEHRELEIEATG